MRHLFFLTLLPSYSHVVFEEIGAMVGSTSYIHITVNVGLQEIKDKVAEYTQSIISYKVLGTQTFKSLAPSWNPVYVPSEQAVRFENQQLEYVNLVEMFVSDAGRLKSRIVNL